MNETLQLQVAETTRQTETTRQPSQTELKNQILTTQNYLVQKKQKSLNGLSPDKRDQFENSSGNLRSMEEEMQTIQEELKTLEMIENKEAQQIIEEFNSQLGEPKQADPSKFEGLSEHEVSRQVQQIAYDIFGIESNTYSNGRVKQLIKGFIDLVVISNAEFLEQIVETKGKILVDMVEYIFTLEGLKSIATALGTSVADLFSGDWYKTGQSIGDLGLITSGAAIAGFGIKKLKKGAIKGLKNVDISEGKIARKLDIDGNISISKTIDLVRDGLGPHKELAEIVEKFLKDTNHRMDINELLKNPDTSEFVIGRLRKIADSGPIDQSTFEKIVRDIKDINHPILQSNDLEFSYINGIKKDKVLSDNLLSSDPELFSIGSNPTPEQFNLLQNYQQRLKTNIEPKLGKILEGIVKQLDHEGFIPQFTTRTKQPDGIADKIKRMVEGNKGKEPRPGYNLSMMPDAVGRRITVENIDDLTQVTKEIEKIFGKDGIIEKDSFYSNPDKINRSYRLVTYTTMVDGVPCEVQINTINASLVGDLDHNIVYKDQIMKASEGQKEYIKGLSRQGNALDLQNIKK